MFQTLNRSLGPAAFRPLRWLLVPDRWDRRLVPLVILLGFFKALSMPLDPDLGWHLRTGQTILQTGRIPTTDSYSFTAHGAPWVDQEWLWQVAMAAIHDAAGPLGVVATNAVIFSTVMLLIYLLARFRGGTALSSGIAAGLGLIALMPIAAARPSLAGALLAAACLGLLELARGNGRRSMFALVTLPLLLILWANMHASFVLAWALSTVFFITETWSAWGRLLRRRSAPRDRRILYKWTGIEAALLLAPLANPRGWQLIAFVLTASRLPFNQQYVAEWAAPSFHSPGGPPVLALVLLSLFAAMVARQGRPASRDVILLMGSSIAVLFSLQFVPLYAIVAPPIVATMLQSALPAELSLGTYLAQFLSFLVVTVLLATNSFGVTGLAAEADSSRGYPAQAVDYIERHGLADERLFNDFNWGGYLIQRLPNTAVFVDGRTELYGSAFLAQYARLITGIQEPAPVLDEYGIQLVLIRAHLPLANGLRQSPGWIEVFQDETAAVFLRVVQQ